jgi:AcrR family transcriptional regulator
VPRAISEINKAGAKAPPGRRELNKNDKLRRIKQAARKYFLTRDFDRATTREIAASAGIALGTLFIYATDKRDLLFLTVNDELEEIVRKAVQVNRKDASVVENFLAVFGLFYRYFAKHPNLSRLVLREMIFYEHGEQAKRFLAARERLMALSGAIIRQGIARGEIQSEEDPDFIGWLVFSIYQAEVRRWLWTDRPSFRAGMARLQRALVVFTTGLKLRYSSRAASSDGAAPRRQSNLRRAPSSA